MPWIDVRDDAIFYSEIGQGAPLVFISGWGGDIPSWEADMAFFSRSFRCLTLEHPGVGGQPAPADGFSTADMADRIAAGLDALGIDAAAVLGMSMGGAVAQQLALRRPDLVDKLVLCATWARFDRRSARAVALLNALLRNADYDTAMQMIYWIVFGAEFYENNLDELDALYKMRRENPIAQEVFDYQTKACLAHDSLEQLQAISCPTLVTHGEQDILIPPHHGRGLAARIPNARYEEFPGCGHSHLWENIREFRNVVLDFLQDA